MAAAESSTAIRQERRALGPSGQVLRRIALVTVAAIFCLVVLGGVVRVTGSGLGCPDWPLCHGRLLPPLAQTALIEYSHRTLASIVGLLVAATAVLAWRTRPRRPWVVGPPTLAVILVIAQALLGGIAVRTELSGLVVLGHLALAEALLATALVGTWAAYHGGPLWPGSGQGTQGTGLLPALASGALVATFGLVLLGSYVTVAGASAACGASWPLCGAHGLAPTTGAPFTHMLHRFVALLVGLFLLATALAARRQGNRGARVSRAAAGALGLYLAQVLVGAVHVKLGFPVATQLLHLVLATALWAHLVALLLLVVTAPRPDLRSLARA